MVKKEEKMEEASGEEVIELMEKVAPKGETTTLGGGTVFDCPKCGGSKIRRTFHERQLGVKYVCKKCNFTGPN